VDVASVAFPERGPVDVARVMEAVRAGAAAARPFSHVAVVHHETTAGVLNDVPALGAALAAHDARASLIVDSMSAFGAYPLDLRASNVHYLVSSSNKCIEGVPGFSFALCARDRLEACGAPGQARSLALDLHAQWAGLQATGEFRFTPPVHALLAFRQALDELELEGGAAGRLARYQANAATLLRGMAALGFAPYVAAPHQGCIITTFLVPDDARFVFKDVYAALERRGFVIYPGKTTKAESFRLGSIGRLFPSDMEALVAALRDVLREAGVKLPVRQKVDA
jgi:2-aminoethylphosphonate-pyruvate transaminase